MFEGRSVPLQHPQYHLATLTSQTITTIKHQQIHQFQQCQEHKENQVTLAGLLTAQGVEMITQDVIETLVEALVVVAVGTIKDPRIVKANTITITPIVDATDTIIA